MAPPSSPAADEGPSDPNSWTLDVLEREIDGIRERLATQRAELSSWFVNRALEVELMGVCAAAQEPLLFVGLPGTAKSDLVLKWVQSVGVDDAYFEYMLTKFTEPSEVLGPIDIDLLKQGRFVRRTQGKLPEAKVAFLDEVFKSNSAILNLLLTIVNERKFYQDGRPIPVPLQVLFGATNDIPDQGELDALSDRFILKVETRPVKDTHFAELIDAGVRGESLRATGQRPWQNGTTSLQDYQKLKRYLDLVFAYEGEAAGRRDALFPPRAFAELRRLILALESEDKVFVSDRKLVKLYKLIRTRAFMLHGGAVDTGDLILCAFIGNRRHEVPAVQHKVRTLLGLTD